MSVRAGRASPSGPVTSFHLSASLTHTVLTAVVTEVTTAVTGAAVGDNVVANPRTTLATGLVYSHARVSAANVVAIGVGNLTTATVTGAAVTWDIAVQHLN